MAWWMKCVERMSRTKDGDAAGVRYGSWMVATNPSSRLSTAAMTRVRGKYIKSYRLLIPEMRIPHSS